MLTYAKKYRTHIFWALYLVVLVTVWYNLLMNGPMVDG